MRIKQQIGLLVAMAAGTALITGAVAVVVTLNLAQTMHDHEPMHPIIEEVVALTTLADNWVRRPTARIEQQWNLIVAQLTTEAIPALQTRGAFDLKARQALLDDIAAADRDFQEAIARRAQSPDAESDRYLEMVGERVVNRLEQTIGDVFVASDATFLWVREDARRSYYIVAAVVAVAVLGSLALGAFVAVAIGRRLGESVNAVSSSAAQMAAAAQEQQRIAVQQAASVSETTTTMDELASSARRSNEQAKGALATLEALSGVTTEARDRTDEMIGQMDRLRADVEAVVGQLRVVGEQADRIDSVTVDVSDIAAQTNLLALNAAVEAVRAGEHGKGFSVVADEIRKLADQSKASAARIRSLVAEAQKRAESSVQVSEGGRETLGNAVTVVGRAVEVFKQVLTAIDGTAERMQQIALTGDQQTKAIEQAVEAMESINHGAGEAVAGLEQTNRAIEQLVDVADRVKRMI